MIITAKKNHLMHSLLERQLRRAGFDYNRLPTEATSWQEFLTRIERSYVNADRQCQLLEQETASQHALLSSHLFAGSPTFPLQSVLTAMSEGVCVFDTQGNVLFINRAAENYLEIKPGYTNLQSQSLLEHFELHDRLQPEQSLSISELLEKLAQGESLRDHNAYLQQANQTLAVSCVFNPIIENQKTIGSVLLFSDITEIKKVESQLRAAKETAEKSSTAKSQFLSSMSHELRTPMNAILGYSELLKEDLSVPLEEFETEHIQDMLQYVGNILHAGWHLLELINKVLDLTRIEAGKLDVCIEKIELIELIKECISIVTPQASTQAITIQNETAALAPHYALADRGRLQQVIINLLSNAVKYNSKGGSLTIGLSQPQVESIRLEVRDTGLGLTAEQKTKVFEPFTRLSGLNLIEGTGIGLTITKQLLELMDGKIGVDSEINVGSTFWIELPTGEVDNGVTETTESHKHILLYVEDSRTNVSLVAQILKARPQIALISAHTGEMGLELARLHQPQIILLDINLPGMDGFEVLAHLRENEPTRKIPVLALTANDATSQLEHGRKAGFFSYIVKPLDIKQFLETIDQALEYSLT